jgi:hypothetical protein
MADLRSSLMVARRGGAGGGSVEDDVVDVKRAEAEETAWDED